MKKNTLALIALWVTTIIWGFGYIGVEDAIQGGWSTFPLMFARFGIAALALIPFTIRFKWWKNKKLLLESLLNAIFLLFAYTLQTIGQKLTSIANTSFLTVMWVVFIPIFLFMITKKKLEIKNYIGVGLSVIGAFILCFEQGMTSINIGDLCVIGTAISFALQIIHLEYLAKKYNILEVTQLQLIYMAVLSFLFIPIFNEWSGFGSGGYLGLLYSALFSSALGFLLQAFGQKYVTPTNAALIFSLESVVATIAAALIYQEEITSHVIIGGLLMLFASILVQVDFKQLFKKNKNGV